MSPTPINRRTHRTRRARPQPARGAQRRRSGPGRRARDPRVGAAAAARGGRGAGPAGSPGGARGTPAHAARRGRRDAEVHPRRDPRGDRDGLSAPQREQLHRRAAAQLPAMETSTRPQAHSSAPDPVPSTTPSTACCPRGRAQLAEWAPTSRRARSYDARSERRRRGRTTACYRHARRDPRGSSDPEGIECSRRARRRDRRRPPRRGSALPRHTRCSGAHALRSRGSCAARPPQPPRTTNSHCCSRRGRERRVAPRRRAQSSGHVRSAVSRGESLGERALLVHVAGDLAARGTRECRRGGRHGGPRRGRRGASGSHGPGQLDARVRGHHARLERGLRYCARTGRMGRRPGPSARLPSRCRLRVRAAGRACAIALATSSGASTTRGSSSDEYPAEDPLRDDVRARVSDRGVDRPRQPMRPPRRSSSTALPVSSRCWAPSTSCSWPRLASRRRSDPAGLADLHEVASRAARAEYLNPAGLCWRSRTALAMRASDVEAARRLAADEVRRARAFGAPRALGVALRAQALVDEPERRIAGLEEACVVLATSRARLEEARARIDLGIAIGQSGATQHAQTVLGDGMTMAHACGARREAERAADALRATGARPRRLAVHRRRRLTRHGARCARNSQRRAQQSRNRRAPIRHPPHGRTAPVEGLSQARHSRPRTPHRRACCLAAAGVALARWRSRTESLR